MVARFRYGAIAAGMLVAALMVGRHDMLARIVAPVSQKCDEYDLGEGRRLKRDTILSVIRRCSPQKISMLVKERRDEVRFLYHPHLGTPLHAAAKNIVFPDVMDIVITLNIALEARDHKGKTALWRAVEGNNTHATEVLIDSGAEKNISVGPYRSLIDYCNEVLSGRPHYESCLMLRQYE